MLLRSASFFLLVTFRLVEGIEAALDGHPPVEVLMAGFDENKDGFIDLKELSKRAGPHHKGWMADFAQVDVDGDSHLNAEELTALLAHITNREQEELLSESEVSIASEIMEGLDFDKDGHLSVHELLTHTNNGKALHMSLKDMASRLRAADKDKDKQLTVAELAAFLKTLGFEDQQHLLAESKESYAEIVMDGFDGDRDGRLSLSELLDLVGGHADEVDETAKMFAAHSKGSASAAFKRLEKHLKPVAKKGSDKRLQAHFQGWETAFGKSDVNKDGHLDHRELSDFLMHISKKDQHDLVHDSEARIASSIMQGFDSNKDGQIELKELLARVGDNSHVHAAFSGWTSGFNLADDDQNGKLDLDELTFLLKHVSSMDQQNLVAESEESVAGSVMDGFDTNKDGKLSLQELEAHVGDKQDLHAAFQGWQEGFKQADADKDGHLTVQELADLLSKVSREDQGNLVQESEKSIGESIMEGFDIDRNGKISLKELNAHIGDKEHVHAAFEGWQDGFKEADADKDGFLSQEELNDLLAKVSRQDQQKLVQDSESSMISWLLDGFDADKNGKLSAEELREHGMDFFSGGFERADADGDLQLDSDELRSFMAHAGKQVMNQAAHQSQQSMVESVRSGFDADKDGKISMKELLDHVGSKSDMQGFIQGWQDGFKEADANKDGHLDDAELADLLSHVTKQERHKLVEESEETAATVMEGFDADKDGKISLAELEAKAGRSGDFQGWEEGFREADADSDGYLTARELASWLKLISEAPKHDEM
mmetsp:Transcript_33896/g.59775  ORF Transcript_33896/g.59775 Transcript_33896/m.59775 type:complete len:771 (+) Transcript_33896:79-2391(+)